MAQSSGLGAGKGYLLGLGLGLVPVLLSLAFGATQCPIFDYACHDPNQGWGGWFFVAAVVLAGLGLLGMIVCLFIRRVRPIGYGLLTMLFIGPVVSVVGCIAISSATHPR